VQTRQFIVGASSAFTSQRSDMTIVAEAEKAPPARVLPGFATSTASI
jgi:hypothetical protein